MKRVLIPAAVLLIVVIIWLVQNKLEWNKMAPKTIDNFLQLNPQEINLIKVKTSADSLTFRLENGRWILEGNPPRLTDSMAVENMIAAAGNIKVGNVISENPERQKDFLVDTVTGNFVEFFNGDKLLKSIFIGKMSPDFTHTYVRKPGSNQVYLAEGLLTYVFNRKHSQWLNRTILALNPDSVNSVEFIYADKAYRITRTNRDWFVAKKPYSDSLPADTLKVNNFLVQICRFKATDFASVADSGLIQFNPPDLTIKIGMTNGTSPSVEFSPIGENSPRAYCRKAGFADIYVFAPSLYDNFRKEFQSFLP